MIADTTGQRRTYEKDGAGSNRKFLLAWRVMDDQPQTLREGSVDQSSPHFELCHGSSNDSPKSWEVVVRVAAEADGAPIFEFVGDADREIVLRLVALQFDSDAGARSIVLKQTPSGVMEDWEGSLRMTCSSTSNWYGNWHWRGAGG